MKAREEKLLRLLTYFANAPLELSHEKVHLQLRDWQRWSQEAVKYHYEDD